MQINLKITGLTETVRALQALHRDQLPYATSVAINNTVLAFQADQRKQMARVFTERRKSWVEQNVKVTHFSKKTETPIHADVAIQSPGGGDRSDILAKFEAGGEKTSTQGGRISIPDEARRTKSDIVARSARPRAFGFTVSGTGPVATVYRGAKRTFMIQPVSGQGGGIYQRVGRGMRGTVRQLFALARRTRIEPRLRFVETAQKVAAEKFPAIADAALEKAIRTAK